MRDILLVGVATVPGSDSVLANAHGDGTSGSTASLIRGPVVFCAGRFFWHSPRGSGLGRFCGGGRRWYSRQNPGFWRRCWRYRGGAHCSSTAATATTIIFPEWATTAEIPHAARPEMCLNMNLVATRLKHRFRPFLRVCPRRVRADR